MSFLSFYNDHHGREGEALLKLIREEAWEEAEFTLRTDPLAVTWMVTIPGFFDGKVTAKVLPAHLACQLRPPASIVTTLHQIHPRGFLKPESAYKRIPLHIACMSSAPTETIALMSRFQGGPTKKKDALGRLPIHYACKDPKMDVAIAHLLKAYSKSTEVADKQGFLPIHVACRSGMPLPVIRLLLQSAPDTIDSKTNKGSTPYMCARHSQCSHKEELLSFLRVQSPNSDSISTSTFEGTDNSC